MCKAGDIDGLGFGRIRRARRLGVYGDGCMWRSRGDQVWWIKGY